MIEVADRVYRLGSWVVNWYLVGDGGRFIVVDTGLPKQFDQLEGALRPLGGTLDDVEAVVLTHAHADHAGSAEEIRTEADVAVHVHEDDADLARGEATRKNERGYARDFLHPFSWKSTWVLISGGALSPPPVLEVSRFSHGETLDLPGNPRIIHTPGHTVGSACIELPDRSALCSGDALVMLNVVTGARGPRIKPSSFNENTSQALDSLSEIAAVSADTLLPGHGEPWTGSMASAVEAARQVGPS